MGATWWGTGTLPLLYWSYLPARNTNAFDLDYQYSNEISVGLFWATARVLPMLGALPTRTIQIWVAACAIAASAGSDVERWQHYSPTFHAEWIRHELAPAIGGDLTVAASDALVPHLATRHWIGNLTMLQQPSGEPVACMVTDDGVKRSVAESARSRGRRA